jgi:PAS domain S-box-containing protein
VTDARVLVVAPGAKIRDKWGDYLQRAGYGACVIATSARDALREIHESHPDVVLVELNTTGDQDGVEIARQIWSRYDLPLVYVVDVAAQDLFERALTSNPDGFVFDPSRPQELQAAITTALRSHRFDLAPHGYLLTDLNGIILEANRTAGRLLGREERQLVNEPLILHVADQDRDGFVREMARAAGAQEPIHWEARLQTGAGHGFQAAVTVSAGATRGAGRGERPILRWLIRDVTQRVTSQEERERLLQENLTQREFLERLVQSAPVGIGVVHGADHRLELSNSTFQSLPGFRARTILGEPLAEILGQASPAILDLLDEVYRSGTVVTLREEKVLAGSGDEVAYWDVDGIPLPGQDGQVEGALLLIGRVTGQVSARHQIEELAFRAEQRAEELDAVFAAMADAVVVYDAGARATRANAAAIAFYGLDPVGEEYVELARRLSVRSLDGQAVALEDLPVPRALQGEAVDGLWLLFRDGAGHEHVVRASAGPVRVGGRTTGAVATWHDITEELGVQQARDRLIAILEATPDMVFIASPGGDLLHMNRAARRTRGLADDASLSGMTFRDVLPAWASTLLEQEAIPTAMHHGIWRGQAAVVNAEGREIPVSKVLVAHRGPDGQVEYLSSIARDVTERQRILAELAEERARLRAVIDNAPVGIVVADSEGKVLLANPAAERLYARPLPNGQAYDSLVSLGLRYPDGSPFDPRDLPFTRSALNGVTLTDAALRITWPGGQQRDLVANSAPIYDPEGRVTGSVSIFRDVTEQGRAEENLRRFSERLKILYDIDQAILAAQTAEEIFPPVLERLARLIPCCHAGILLHVSEADELQLRLGDESGNHELIESVGLTLADLADAGVKQVGDLESLAYPSPLERLLQVRDLRAYAGAPLIAGNRLLGFLFIGSDEPHGLHPEAMQIVGEVARSLALAIQHDLLRADLVRHGVQLSASLREKDLMLQEIHHRVKNNLQIISSLLDMEATTIPDPTVVQALQDSRNRVKTMALIHERLYQSPEVGSVPAPAYVRSITSYLFGVHRSSSLPVELDLKVQDVFLDINTAIPLGLILNELVSNALKYAFTDHDTSRGRLRVQLDQEDSRLVLQVSDNGSGFPVEVNWRVPRTLGLKLVKVLTEQLRGSLELDRQDGTTFRISFPRPDKKHRGEKQ